MPETYISVGAIRRLLGRGVEPRVLDVRGSAAYRASPVRIAGDIRVMAKDVAEITQRIDPGDWILAYCTCLDDGLAVRAAERLHGLGFLNARAVVGGLDGCVEAGLELAGKEEGA